MVQDVDLNASTWSPARVQPPVQESSTCSRSGPSKHQVLQYCPNKAERSLEAPIKQRNAGINSQRTLQSSGLEGLRDKSHAVPTLASLAHC